MRSKLRSRLTYANVVATLALFLVLGGGTALASFVISSNSQVGPSTISGHKPPTGKHSNIIAGSINGTDLAGNSVNGAKILDGSITGSDVAPNSVAGALGVRTGFNSAFPGDPPATLFTHGPWTLTGTCTGGGGNAQAEIQLSSGSNDAVASIDDANGSRFTGTAPTAVAQTQTAITGTTTVKGGHFSAWAVGFTNHLSGNVLATADAVPGDFGGPGPVCLFQFEGVGS
jgi:hypothetical protein